MQNLTTEDLKEILNKHLKWRNGEEGGERANLRRADLSYANLSYANLSYAYLNDANLSYADLRRADLRRADLRRADLSRADLRGAALSGANTDKRYIIISCIGSRKDSTTYCFKDDTVWCGCFSGNLADFEKAVKETHADNAQYLKEYTGAIQYIRSLI